MVQLPFSQHLACGRQTTMQQKIENFKKKWRDSFSAFGQEYQDKESFSECGPREKDSKHAILLLGSHILTMEISSISSYQTVKVVLLPNENRSTSSNLTLQFASISSNVTLILGHDNLPLQKNESILQILQNSVGKVSSFISKYDFRISVPWTAFVALFFTDPLLSQQRPSIVSYFHAISRT